MATNTRNQGGRCLLVGQINVFPPTLGETGREKSITQYFEDKRGGGGVEDKRKKKYFEHTFSWELQNIMQKTCRVVIFVPAPKSLSSKTTRISQISFAVVSSWWRVMDSDEI